MSSRFCVTYDGTHQSLVLVTGQEIIDDVAELTVKRNADGTYACSVVRSGDGKPVRLVASTSPEGRRLLEKARGVLSDKAPGFVEVPITQPGEPDEALQQSIAAYFANEPVAPVTQPEPRNAVEAAIWKWFQKS